MRIALFNLSMSGFQELLLEKKYRDYEVNNNNGKLYFGSFLRESVSTYGVHS